MIKLFFNNISRLELVRNFFHLFQNVYKALLHNLGNNFYHQNVYFNLL